MRTDTLWVDSPLLATLTQIGDTPGTNPGALIQGVANRSYGVVNGGSAAPTYTATGGLGQATVGVGHYQWCISSTPGLPAGFLNTAPSVNTPCTSPDVENTATLSAGNVTAAPNTYSFTMELDDAGNGSTPSSVGIASATRTTSLLINPALAIQLDQTGNPAGANPASLLPAVFNRTYGSGSNCLGGACAPPVYTASGGLGGYVFPASPGPFPTGFACSPTTTTYTCLAGTAVAAAPATYSNLILTVSDTSNPAVPNGSASSNTSLLVNPQIQLAQTLTANWPDAVHGRAYGIGSTCYNGTPTPVTCAPALYSASNGLGGYVWPATPASLSALGMSCSVVAPNYSCSAAAITALPTTPGAGSQSYSPSATVTDTPNAATPAATPTTDPNSTRTDTLIVDSPLLATLTQATNGTNPGALLAGVANRSYGVSGGTPTYTATGGLRQGVVGNGPYEWCITSAGALPA
jgi:hypothetical protein